MFLLEDGRKHLYQWDVNRRIQVEDPTIAEVHFCNRTDDCALVVETYTDDTYDGKTYADIPNIILQQPWDIRAYAYCTDGFTKIEEVFEVKARTKPADYVYTETVVKSVEEIFEAAERVSTTANEFYEFAEDYKMVFQDDGEGNVELTAISGGGEGEDIDLSEYAKKTDIPDVSDFISEIPDEYITETELNAKGYLTQHQSLEGYATEKYVDDAIANIEIPEGDGGSGSPLYQHTIAINGSFTSAGVVNPNIYVTFVDSNSEVYTLGTFTQRLYEKAIKLAVSGNAFASSTLVPVDYLEATSATTLKYHYRYSSDQLRSATITTSNNVSFADTVVRVGTASVSGGGEAADLSNYYTKDETYSKTEVDGLIPEPTDLTGYATETYVTQAIQTALSGIAQAEGGAY